MQRLCPERGPVFIHRRGAARTANVAKPAISHTCCRSFATRLLEDSPNIRTVQDLLLHRDVSTPMMDPRALNRGWGAVRSSADRLLMP
jgi:integrase